jgi:hypothetical protein
MQNNNNLNIYHQIISAEKKIEKTIGETRHFPPASKEWKNSVYAYNKNTVKTLPAKDKMANSLLRSYFNFVPISINNTKSKRMRNLIRRSSTKKLFISRPEIKQTNSKVIITAYTADRERETFLRKIYYFNRSLKRRRLLVLQNIFKKQTLNNNFVTLRDSKNTTYVHDVVTTNSNVVGLSGFNSEKNRVQKIRIRNLAKFSRIDIRKTKAISRLIMLRKRALAIRRRKRVKINSILRKNMFRNRLVTSIVRKKTFLKNIFFYSFMKWALSMFSIKVNINDFSNKRSIRNKLTNEIVINKGDCYKVLKIKKGSFSASFEATNIMLLQLLVVTMKKALNNVKSPVSLEKFIYFLFKYFKAAYYESFVQKYLKKEVLALNHLYMLTINKFKFEKFLPGLKLLIGKLYNKKVELNLVNLKYLHLNSDIFAESVAIKLRNKKNSLLRVLRRSLKLVKIPKKLNNNNGMDSANALNKSSQEDKKVIFKDVLNVFLEKMYPRFVSLVTSNKSNVNKTIDTNNSLNLMPVPQNMKLTSWGAKKLSVLNSLKYKWITGARLEAKGRLTKRFTASRSQFKFRYKGNLKIMEPATQNALNNVNYTNKSAKTVMLRNQIKPNIQYTFVNSKRRIGAFGIKGWISSN